MSVILVGYRGSGKSSVARCLAEQLRWKLIDTDLQIVQEAGTSIRDLFEKHGETEFRNLESFHVRAACEQENAVISLGGGAVLREENREAIQVSKHPCFYLQCSAEELARRIHADPATAHARPALTPLGGTLEEISLLLSQREPLYRQVATEVIDVTLTPFDVVCQAIRERL